MDGVIIEVLIGYFIIIRLVVFDDVVYDDNDEIYKCQFIVLFILVV